MLFFHYFIASFFHSFILFIHSFIHSFNNQFNSCKLSLARLIYTLPKPDQCVCCKTVILCNRYIKIYCKLIFTNSVYEKIKGLKKLKERYYGSRTKYSILHSTNERVVQPVQVIWRLTFVGRLWHLSLLIMVMFWHLSLAVTFVEAKMWHLSLAVTCVEAKLWHLSLAVTFVEAKLWHLSRAVTFVEAMLWHLSLTSCDICRGLLWHLSRAVTFCGIVTFVGTTNVDCKISLC